MYSVFKKKKNIHIETTKDTDKNLINRELSAISTFAETLLPLSTKISNQLTDLILNNKNKRIELNEVIIEQEYFSFLKGVVEDNLSYKISKITKTLVDEEFVVRFEILLKIIKRYKC